HRGPALDLVESGILDLGIDAVERLRSVDGIGQLLPFAPALRRPLLEQADRIADTGVEVAQRGLLQCGHDGGADRPVLEVASAADADDEAGVVALLLTELVVRSHLHLPDLRGTE